MFSASRESFVPDQTNFVKCKSSSGLAQKVQDHFHIGKFSFCSGTESFEAALNTIQFLAWARKFGPVKMFWDQSLTCCHIKKDFWARWWGRWPNQRAFSGRTTIHNNNFLFHNTLGCRSKRLNLFEYIHAQKNQKNRKQNPLEIVGNCREGIPSITCPKTTCFPSNQGVSATVRKNWAPLVFGPELAIDISPEK